MAEVYKGLSGVKMEELIALLPEVQSHLEDATLEIGGRAEALLAEHHDSGAAEIDIESGDIDHYVVLSDERGQLAALSIEFGRQPHRNSAGEMVGGMDGLHILGRAAHLKAKGRRK